MAGGLLCATDVLGKHNPMSLLRDSNNKKDKKKSNAGNQAEDEDWWIPKSVFTAV